MAGYDPEHRRCQIFKHIKYDKARYIESDWTFFFQTMGSLITTEHAG